MKNKFLIFSLLSVFASGLLIYLHSQISLAAITSVTTNTSAVGSTSATLSGTLALTDNVNEAYNVRGFNFGTASAAAGNYTSSSTETGTFTGGATFTHATTSLSKGTAYYLRAYAASSTINSIVYGSEVSILTGIDDPNSLIRASHSGDSIDLSWTKGTGASNTYIRYRADQYPTSITDGTQGCIVSGSSCSKGGLNCGSTYYFRAWSSTTAAGLSTTSISYAQLTDSTDACPVPTSGGRVCVGPRVFSDSLVINQAAAKTQAREVTLNLKADSATLMSICNNSNFLGCSLESYSATKSWTLTEGDGEKTVYAVFNSDCGMNSDPVSSDTITLKTVVEEMPAPAPALTPEPTPTPEPKLTPEVTPTPTPVPAPVEKSISELTIDELKNKITGIMAQIQSLQAELTQPKEAVTFEVNLKYGNRGDDVVKLQEFLIGEGFLSDGLNTGWFGPATKVAVIKFQEKYAKDILIPLGLTKGTGFVGSSTQAKLNTLLGK